MANHGIVRTDNLFGTKNTAGLVNIKCAADIDNGNVVIIGAMAAGERDAYSYTTPAANSKMKDVVLIASPEVMYESGKRALADFYNAEGSIARGYILHNGDVFSLSADAYTGTAAVGSVVELAASTKLKVASSLTSGSTQVGTVVAIENGLAVVRVSC